MLRQYKKSITALAMAAALSCAGIGAPTKAEAGLVFLPFATAPGLYFGLSGALVMIFAKGKTNRLMGAAIFVLGVDGSPNQGSLAQALSEKYPSIDTQAIQDLATAISEKAMQVKADEAGQKVITFTQPELSAALGASNIE